MVRVHSLALSAALLALSALPVHTARAAQSYDSCIGFIDTLPAVITTQGTWCMRKDLSTGMASGAAITIDTNNVTIDCNHFKLGGLLAGPGTNTYGIFENARLNATVRNCNVRGFRRGISFLTGSGHLVEDSRFEGMRSTAIYMGGDGVVRRNLVLDTAGSDAATVAIWAYFNSEVIDNSIDGVFGEGPGTSVYGIATQSNEGASITGNRIRGLDRGLSEGTAIGIYVGPASRVQVEGNQIVGPGYGAGILCEDNLGLAIDNAISNFSATVNTCVSSGNVAGN